MPLLSVLGFRSPYAPSASKLEEDIRKLAELWELLVDQIKQVEESVLSFPLRKPGILQAQKYKPKVVRLELVMPGHETYGYIGRMRQSQPSEVESYYPRLKELAQPIVRLLKAFIARKAAIEDLRCLGALEVVAYDLKRINKGYHENLKEEAGQIKRGVDEAFIEVLDVYKVSI
ncbi:hypothetical protein Clacol_005940 [Clathrus columnatus]|uniref:Uncharacterized protein n=1 Tax=Clathrus columnatus TaxID=1419009 RepID=A0AAV5AEU4_9AGAM|nr:hypothetical protein Clacol_005940 [Clathrus columnatus]